MIDTARQVRSAGGRAIVARAEAIDRDNGVVELDDGRAIPFDVVSMDVGSRVPEGRIPGSAEHGYRVKPFDGIRELRDRLRIRLDAGESTRLVIAGGGASAAELAANIEAAARRAGAGIEVTMLTDADRLLVERPPRAAAQLARHLARRGIRLETERALVRVEAGRAFTADDGSHPFDLFIDATGLVPEPLARRSGLPDVDGALLVDRFLRSIADARVFGAGDAMRMQGSEDIRPVGVHAVRQGPALLHNLIAALEGRPLRPWGPPRTIYLSILDLGDDTALATFGPFHVLGRSARWLKDRIDARFLERHTGLAIAGWRRRRHVRSPPPPHPQGKGRR